MPGSGQGTVWHGRFAVVCLTIVGVLEDEGVVNLPITIDIYLDIDVGRVPSNIVLHPRYRSQVAKSDYTHIGCIDDYPGLIAITWTIPRY
ncbi:hypothetical protein ES703_117618 [subsurface metagenome]